MTLPLIHFYPFVNVSGNEWSLHVVHRCSFFSFIPFFYLWFSVVFLLLFFWAGIRKKYMQSPWFKTSNMIIGNKMYINTYTFDHSMWEHWTHELDFESKWICYNPFRSLPFHSIISIVHIHGEWPTANQHIYTYIFIIWIEREFTISTIQMWYKPLHTFTIIRNYD